jgi:DNA-directed RNA polymerase subunit L
MKPHVTNLDEAHGILTFTITGINVSMINALRRVLLAEVPTIIFRTTPYKENGATFHKNTTRFNNEILKQRLSCIPVHITDNLTDDELAEYEVEIKGKNDGGNIEMVTTADFRIQHQGKYLASHVVKTIFPPDPITNDYILFARLRPKISEDVPGEELYITAKLSIGVGAENSSFNSVSTCSYAMTPDKKKQYDEWARVKEAIEDKAGEDRASAHKNWLLHDGKRVVIPNSFDFRLETIGVFTNKILIQKASEIINAKLDNIKKAVSEQKMQITRSTTTLENSFDIILENEGYTIGKVLEFILYEKYYINQKVLSYLGFIKKHPHDTDGLLRIAFRDNVDHTRALELLVDAIADVTRIFNTIHHQFA